MSESPVARVPVLLIDDDDLIAGSLRQYLTMHGCDVDVAVALPLAEELMRGRSYDVVLVDPFFTGAIHADSVALLGSICSLQPRAALIVLTAYASPELEHAVASCQGAGLLTKPQSVVYLSQLMAGTSMRAPVDAKS